MARAAKTTKPAESAPKARRQARLSGAPSTAPDKVSAAATPSRRSAVTIEAPERRKPGRPKATAVAASPKATKAAKQVARSPASPRTTMISKGELRAQIEKLEKVIATLRAKSRESNKATKAAMSRISELEGQVAKLEKIATTASVSARAAEPKRARRRSREIDPGDAVPPGVAAQDPAPLDEEAKAALENLEEHLAH